MKKLLKEADALRTLGSFFKKYQDELDNKADLLEEESYKLKEAKK